jgi:flagellar motor switch protein FliG
MASQPKALLTRSSEASEMAPIPGPVKAAILLLALGEEHGAALWDMLDTQDIRKVSAIMSRLGSIDTDTLKAIAQNFLNETGRSSLSGDTKITEKILMNALPRAKAKSIIDEIKLPDNPDVWQKFSFTQPESLAKYLRNQHPQIAAVILSKLESAATAKILALLPNVIASDILNRMLKIDTVDDACLEIIEGALKEEFSVSEKTIATHDPVEQISKIFNFLDKKSETRILSSLDETNHAAAQKIRALLFSFEDLTKLSPAAAQVLVRAIDREILIKALKGSTRTMKDFFFSQMSQRAAKALQDELDILGPIRLKDVDEAQRVITNLAKDLAAKGEIMLASNSADDELI